MHYYPQGMDVVLTGPKQVDWFWCLPFVFLHLGCLLVFWVGWSPVAIAVTVLLYFIRMFAITGFYHRYFSHRTFKTSRLMQFAMGVWGMTSVQKGPLWWASHHREHHRSSDQQEDIHSPKQRGFWWSHIGWIACAANIPTRYDRIKDLARYPELVFINRFDWLVPLLFALSLVGLGTWLNQSFPSLHTNGLQILVWGFFVSTAVLFHGTCSINSLSHVWGSQRFVTGDMSRNNFCLALITLGEGWHNNHHHYQGSARQGFYWWEIDMTYYALRLMSLLGLIWDINPVPDSVYTKANKRVIQDQPA
ncbi:MAG: acyl-CoA desaturase [Cyanobacteria bacterium]|nr:acyl-CoA desaturase [Cyanobacteriota bacterium]